MAYQSFAEQVESHRKFLRSNGLAVESLQVDAGFVRCCAINEEGNGRGDYAYRTQKNALKKPGMAGLITWARGIGGVQLEHKTYGLDGTVDNCAVVTLVRDKTNSKKRECSEDLNAKARSLWDAAKETGRSDYLERKEVGAYGIRFMENDYGRVAVIPAFDKSGTIRTLQFLNPDSSKRFLRGSVGDGLFHMLRTPKNGEPIGLSESYVTAATCFELTGIAATCAFHSGNLLSVSKSLLEMFPDSRLIIFADNDRHLEQRGLPNQGVLKAQQASETLKDRVGLAVPDFGDCEPSKEATDWNDLVRIKGRDYAKSQIARFIPRATV